MLLVARGDFLTRLAAVPGLASLIERSLFILRPPSREALREAIVGPARALGVSFERDSTVADLIESTVDGEGGLPLLQFALSELWDARDTARRVIPEAACQAIGGVSGALVRHADGVLLALLPAQKTEARRLFGMLVTPEGTRARRLRSELCGSDGEHLLAESTLEALVKGRLLVAQTAGHEPTYELAHEALLIGWDTLRAWLNSDEEGRILRHRVERAAAEWSRLDRRPDMLFGARQLAEVSALDRRGARRERTGVPAGVVARKCAGGACCAWARSPACQSSSR